MAPNFEATFGKERAKIAQHIFDSGRRLIGMADAQLKGVTTVGGRDRSEAGFQVIAHGSLLRMVQLLSGALVLFAGPYPRVSLVMNRAVFELNMTLVYLRRDKRRRVCAFLKYPAIQRHDYLMAAKKHRKILGAKYKAILKEEREAIIKDYRDVRKSFPNAYRWSNKSIHKIAKIVGAGALYDFHYAIMSDEAHGLPMSIDRCFGKNEQGVMVLRADFVPSETLESMHRTIEWAHQIAAIHADEFDKAKLPGLEAERAALNTLPA